MGCNRSCDESCGVLFALAEFARNCAALDVNLVMPCDICLMTAQSTFPSRGTICLCDPYMPIVVVGAISGGIVLVIYCQIFVGDWQILALNCSSTK